MITTGGSSIRTIKADGTVECETDDTGSGTINGVTAGIGLTGGGTSGTVSLAVDTTTVQARVTGSCAVGSSIRVIKADGTVECETDDTGSGGVTGVTAGSGLGGGGTSGNVTISLSKVEQKHLDTKQVQVRVNGACNPGDAIRSISEQGNVTCESIPSVLSCTTRTTSFSGNGDISATVSCQSGETRTGGGFSMHDGSVGPLDGRLQSSPSGSNSWFCRREVGANGASNTCYVICCKFQ